MNLHKNKCPPKAIPDWCHVNLISSFKIYVATDGTIYKQDVRDMCHNTGRKHVNESDNIDVDKNSQEKEGGFSFLDRPELEEHANTINESNKCRHRSLERGAYDGFTQIDQDMVSSAVDQSLKHHNESFDSVTEAVLLDDGIIRQCSLSQQVSVDGETWLTEEFSEKIETHLTNPEGAKCTDKREKIDTTSNEISMQSSDTWTPVLILVPVRLGGGEKLNPIYEECVKAILASDNSVGIIGKSRRICPYML